MTSPPLVVALANARAERRPANARRPSFDDALADVESARELLEPFLDRPLGATDLRHVRALHRALVPVVGALVDGSKPPMDALNRLAAREPAVYGLERAPEGELRAVISPKRPSVAGKLVFELIRELGELEPSRLRRCARPECGLVFYDSTRSATRRWHSENPCGLRERQRRHRSRDEG